MEIKKTRNIVLIVAVAFLVISLTQKCYCTTSLCGDSLAVFAFGILGITFGGAALCWLANPFLIFSWIFIKKNILSTLLSLVAFLIALSFLLFDEVIDNEAGHYNEIIGYELGYWLWVSSGFITFLGNILIMFRAKV